MRIYTNFKEAVKEVERDLWEMGIRVHPQTMQDKEVANDPDYETVELQGYAFKIQQWKWNYDEVADTVAEWLRTDVGDEAVEHIMRYILTEFAERMKGESKNPGCAYLTRKEIWDEYLHDGYFSYTYSDRLSRQISRIIYELQQRPETRQAIMTIHSNIRPAADHRIETTLSEDALKMGGKGRVPCSLYYQLMIRRGLMDFIYSMRSCDFLIHFVVDIAIATKIQDWFADKLELKGTGEFTYFVGSLHAYQKDMKTRGIF